MGRNVNVGLERSRSPRQSRDLWCARGQAAGLPPSVASTAAQAKAPWPETAPRLPVGGPAEQPKVHPTAEGKAGTGSKEPK